MRGITVLTFTNEYCLTLYCGTDLIVWVLDYIVQPLYFMDRISRIIPFGIGIQTRKIVEVPFKVMLKITTFEQCSVSVLPLF